MDKAQARQAHYRNRPRTTCNIDVTWREAGQGDGAPEHTARTRDVSIGGAFLITDHPAPPDTRLLVTLHLDQDRQLTLDADVRWVPPAGADGERGMGVCFLGLTIDQAQELGIYLVSAIETIDYDDIT
jgi:Tfp pilus assembly protein PilZ